MTSGNSGVVSFRLLQAVTKWIIKIKLDHANFLENFDRISEFSSKWILISGILSENIKANYTERYDSLLKMKNHVSVQCPLNMRFECGSHPYSVGTVRAHAQCGLLVTLVMLHTY